MKSVHILLKRESSYSGLGLIATCSAMIGPLSLEIIYNHADLWFSGPWQDGAYPWIWLAWTCLGLGLTAPWSLDRKFHGISREVHLGYSLHLSAIGVAVYAVFGLPTCLWLHKISLVEASTVIESMSMSVLILLASSISASFAELKLSSIISMTSGVSLGALLIYGAWRWLDFGLI